MSWGRAGRLRQEVQREEMAGLSRTLRTPGRALGTGLLRQRWGSAAKTILWAHSGLWFLFKHVATESKMPLRNNSLAKFQCSRKF